LASCDALDLFVECMSFTILHREDTLAAAWPAYDNR